MIKMTVVTCMKKLNLLRCKNIVQNFCFLLFLISDCNQ